MSNKYVKRDRINQKILTTLQKNARISNIELADIVALSPSACLQRVKAMESAGLIKGYVMNSDIDALCHNVKAYMIISMKSNDYQSCSVFEQFLKDRDEVVDCLRVNGDVDYIALVMCTSIEDYNEFSDLLLNKDIGIDKLNSHFVMSSPKWFGGYPLDSLEWKS